MEKSFVEENYTQTQNHLQQTIKCRNTYYNHNNITNKTTTKNRVRKHDLNEQC